MRVFALRNGEFIEYRASERPLKCILSRYIKKDKHGKVKIKLEQRFFMGGEVLGKQNVGRYFDLTWDHHLPPLNADGDVAEMPAIYAKKLLNIRTRRGILNPRRGW